VYRGSVGAACVYRIPGLGFASPGTTISE